MSESTSEGGREEQQNTYFLWGKDTEMVDTRHSAFGENPQNAQTRENPETNYGPSVLIKYQYWFKKISTVYIVFTMFQVLF